MHRPTNRPAVSVGAIFDRIRRLAAMDASVFEEVRDQPGETVPALLVVSVATFLAAVGGWLWLEIDIDGLDTGKIVVKELLLGSIFSLLLWGAWVLVTQAVLATLFRVPTPPLALVRTMGYAAAPLALTVAMLIPTVSFGIGLVALVIWFALTGTAIQATAPRASRGQILIANLIGFTCYAVLLAILADSAGLAPGLFVHGADLAEYFDFDALG